MKRRRFLLATGMGVLSSSGISAINQQPAVAVDFELSATEFDNDFSNVESVVVAFDRLDISSNYVDENSEIRVSVEVALGDYSTEQKEVYVEPDNTKIKDISDILGSITVSTNRDVVTKSVSGSVTVRIEHPDVSDEYLRTFTTSNTKPDHINNYNSTKQSTADDGSITLDSDWQQIMSDTITTTEGSLYVDFHASVTGATHHTFGLRILIDGVETTLVRQTDSDLSNEKMVSIFDVSDVEAGTHSVTIEWKGYPINTYQTYYTNRPTDVSWNIEQEASLSLMELNESGTAYQTEETATGSMSGNDWTELLTTTYSVKSESTILFKAFLSSHVEDPGEDTWNKTRLKVNGNVVNYSRSGESNNAYVINSLLHVDDYLPGDEIQISLEWRKDLGQYILDGATARLGVFEFMENTDYLSKRGRTGSAPTGGYGELNSGTMTNNGDLVYSSSQVSADVTNDNDYFMRLLNDGTEQAWQTTGVSDNGAYDSMLVSSLTENTNESVDIRSEWRAEGSTGLVDSRLIGIGLRTSKE